MGMYPYTELEIEQEKQIERLQEQLDREIHINRKMKSALKQIASENDCYLTIADKVLKEIDNKE